MEQKLQVTPLHDAALYFYTPHCSQTGGLPRRYSSARLRARASVAGPSVRYSLSVRQTTSRADPGSDTGPISRAIDAARKVKSRSRPDRENPRVHDSPTSNSEQKLPVDEPANMNIIPRMGGISLQGQDLAALSRRMATGRQERTGSSKLTCFPGGWPCAAHRPSVRKER
jgi:hypothetical protein